MKRFILFTCLLSWILPGIAWGDVTRGIFGIPSVTKLHPSRYISQLRKAHINAVFVPKDGETIRWFRAHGFKVYIAFNAFGGKASWKRYPDSRVVKADGSFLGSEADYKGYGDVCATHQGWRRERLQRIERLVRQFGGDEGIDGIWLDFIRYPGLWEVKEPIIPDTCYCMRCLEKFQHDTTITLPHNCGPKEAATRIRENYHYQWMKWKKEQISSFVAEVRGVLDRLSPKKQLTLGLFLVPWTKGERRNAISYRLAQDAFQLSRKADVISPMLYHTMCGHNHSWVGYMTRYYKERAHCKVWPIVKAGDCRVKEFAHALEYAGRADADGILIFSFSNMKRDFWRYFKAFQKPTNLIENPAFHVPEGNKLPTHWHTGTSKTERVKKCRFLIKLSDEFPLRKKGFGPRHLSNCIGIKAGNDRAGFWYSRLPDCEPGVEYTFTGQFYREKWENGIYPIISLWGEKYYVDTNWRTKTFQPIRLYVTCPEKTNDRTFRFINHNPDTTLWLTRPHLSKSHHLKAGSRPSADQAFFSKDFFPIGVYGATKDNLEEMKGLNINTVIIGGRGEKLKKAIVKCRQLDLKYVIVSPREPDRLHVFLKDIREYVRGNSFAFYVNDEPGIHSFSVGQANDNNRLIKKQFPGSATCMAVVRPQVCRDYSKASDFFMMDQYPVPFMPMTWLSDSMDQAAKDVDRNRLASVIQAFGGKKREGAGWPRMPTWQEMDCLAFLSVIHGSRGIFFFTFREIGKTKEGRQRLGRVTDRLNKMYPWLMETNLKVRVNVEMVSRHQLDPKGRPSIHCSIKKRGNAFLLIAVNTLQTYVEAVIRLDHLGIRELRDSKIGEWKEIFSDVWYPLLKGGIRAKFGPFETKAFLGNAEGS